MDRKSTTEQYSDQETQRRVEAALRGARIAGYKPMKEIPRKRPRVQRKPRKKATPSASS
jgi:hypothetical protein